MRDESHQDAPMQGRIVDAPPPGTTPSHERATFSDPLPENTDPTSPGSPETTLSFQQRDDVSNDPDKRASGDIAPQMNIEDWRRQDVNQTPD